MLVKYVRGLVAGGERAHLGLMVVSVFDQLFRGLTPLGPHSQHVRNGKVLLPLSLTRTLGRITSAWLAT